MHSKFQDGIGKMRRGTSGLVSMTECHGKAAGMHQFVTAEGRSSCCSLAGHLWKLATLNNGYEMMEITTIS
jgi:hypothetical protein